MTTAPNFREIQIGVALGAIFSAVALISTAIDPLADDSVFAVALFYLPMFSVWGLVGASAYRRTGRLASAVVSGACVAFVTFVVFHLGQFVRLNAFLDALRGRPDWQRLVSTFPGSGFESFRAYANAFYLREAPVKILAFSTFGAVCGLLGGVVAFGLRPRDAKAVGQ